MDARKIISFFIAIGWHIVKNGFAMFLEDRSTVRWGAKRQQSSKCDLWLRRFLNL